MNWSHIIMISLNFLLLALLKLISEHCHDNASIKNVVESLICETFYRSLKWSLNNNELNINKVKSLIRISKQTFYKGTQKYDLCKMLFLKKIKNNLLCHHSLSSNSSASYLVFLLEWERFRIVPGIYRIWLRYSLRRMCTFWARLLKLAP